MVYISVMPLGFHVGKSGGGQGGGKGKPRTMAVALATDMELLDSFHPCAQIFVSGPQSFRETLTPEDKIATGKYIRDNNLPVVIHGAYVDHPWNRAAGSVHNIKQEMRIAHAIGANGVIVHLGAGASDDENLKYVLEELSKQPEESLSVMLWLEIHTAKPGPNTYETPAKLKILFERIGKINHKLKLGLCIDTAHLFACGMSLNSREIATEWLAGLPDVPYMLHLNDSASKLGSGKDQHAALCAGGVWSQYHPETGILPIEQSGLVAILEWAERLGIMVVLERDPDNTPKDLELIRKLGFFLKN